MVGGPMPDRVAASGRLTVRYSGGLPGWVPGRCRPVEPGARVAGRSLAVDELCLPPQVSTQRAATTVGFASVQPVADRLSLLPVVKQAGMP